MKVIALTGRAGSGKDTAAAMLQILTGASASYPQQCIELDHYMQRIQTQAFDCRNRTGGFDVYKLAFPVYKIVAVLLGISDPYSIMNQAFKDSVTPFGFTGRELLQRMGTECFRDVIGKEVWCTVFKNKVETDAENIGEYFQGAIISDLRFLNEAQYIRDRYETFIIRLDGRDSGTPKDHPSEAEIDLICPDIALKNTGSYADLMNQLAAACQYLNIYNCKYTWQ
jgi:hypothetical protein